MKRLIVLVFVLTSLSFLFQLKAQDNSVMGGVFKREHVQARKPIPYYHLREADAMWSKKVWRILDLREKMNQVLYYPTDNLDNRKNLFRLLMEGIENDGITVYEYDEYEMIDEFAGTPKTLEQINLALGAANETSEIEDLETGEMVMQTTTKDPKPEEVFRMILKEEFVFDRQRSKMEIRTIGMAPFRWYVEDVPGVDGGVGELEKKLKPLFWARFEDYRPIFAANEVFNPYNDAERRTFDDIFFKRRFSSHIYKITNKHNNRPIKSYKKGEDALLEAESIADWLFKFEHDLWEF